MRDRIVIPIDHIARQAGRNYYPRMHVDSANQYRERNSQNNYGPLLQELFFPTPKRDFRALRLGHLSTEGLVLGQPSIRIELAAKQVRASQCFTVNKTVENDLKMMKNYLDSLNGLNKLVNCR